MHTTTIYSISRSEFSERRRLALAQAESRGLEALLVWSRGGPNAEYGDVYYLSNWHSPNPPMPNSQRWSAKGHAAMLLPVEGDPVLLADTLDDPDDRISVDDARVAPYLPRAVGELIKDLGLAQGKIGLVGEDAFLRRDWLELVNAIGSQPQLERADDIMADLRFVKSESELLLVRHAADIGCLWMNTTLGALQPGITEARAVGAGLAAFAAHGGNCSDVGISSGPDIDHFWSSMAIPHWNSTRQLQSGDLVHCDQLGAVQGYLTDIHRSAVVGRKPSGPQRELLEGAAALIEHIINGMAVGVTFDELYRRGATWMIDNGFDDAGSGHSFEDIFPAFGHSIGLMLEVPYVVEGETRALAHNSVVAIEGVVGTGGEMTGLEHNVLVTDGGVEILDAACPVRWWD